MGLCLLLYSNVFCAFILGLHIYLLPLILVIACFVEMVKIV